MTNTIIRLSEESKTLSWGRVDWEVVDVQFEIQGQKITLAACSRIEVSTKSLSKTDASAEVTIGRVEGELWKKKSLEVKLPKMSHLESKVYDLVLSVHPKRIKGDFIPPSLKRERECDTSDTASEATTPAKQARSTGHISSLPKDMLKKILAELPASEDRYTKLVCVQWNQIISSLPLPNLKICGPEAWQKYFKFKFKEETSILKQPRPYDNPANQEEKGENYAWSWSHVRGRIPPLPEDIAVSARLLAGGAPCSVYVMPQGLSLNNFLALIRNPAMGDKAIQLANIAVKERDSIVQELGKESLNSSYWIVMKDGVIGRGKEHAEQTLPTTLEAMVCCVMHYLSSGQHVFARDPLVTYTLCKEQVDGQRAPTPAGQGDGTLGLPNGVLRLILEKLPSSEDRSTKPVCKIWNQIISTLPDPNLSVFGPEAWQKFYNFKIEGEIPPLPKDIGVFTRSLRNRLDGKEYGPPCTAILMPKGLTLNKLRELMEKPVDGNSTKIQFILDRIIEVHGDRHLEESYWIVMTNDVIEGSRDQTYEDQVLLVDRKTRSECQLPLCLEAIACCIMHYVSTGKCIFPRALLTYTRCQEQIDDSPLSVGSVAPAGFHVTTPHSIKAPHGGVAARRKF